jgi:NADPH2:quinone reductase
MAVAGVRGGVKACGVNFPDVLMLQDKYQFRPSLPFPPGGEVAGVVKEVGPGVAELRPGDRVCASIGHGGFAEEAVADVPLPLKQSADGSLTVSRLRTHGGHHVGLDGVRPSHASRIIEKGRLEAPVVTGGNNSRRP